MKNILLATTGLFGAALLASAATAQTPKVTLGGFHTFEAGFVSDDFDANTRTQEFRNDTEISVRVDGKTDAGMGYGAVIDLEADTSNDADSADVNSSRTFTYLEANWGRFELGDTKGAAATTRVDASTLAAATGGINGSWTYQPNLGVLGGLALSGGFITTSQLVTEHGSTTALGSQDTENSTKISYYTPKFSGFQAGISYTPKLNSNGQNINRADSTGQFGDIIEAGIGYDNTFTNGIRLAASLTGETGNADAATGEDLGAYALGALLGYQGFSGALSYGNWGDSDRIASNIDSQHYWSAGLGYETGPYAVSATYLNSTREIANVDNDFNNIVIGADYKLAPGLTPYAEVSFYEFDQGGAGGYDNDGTSIVLGTQLAF
jgi:outer membrane protein OmpU